MAFAASVVWDVRTTGSDANGGGFDPTSGVPGTDYSQQDAAQITYTDMVIDGTTNTKFTSAGNPVTAAHVGNIINVTSGTGFTVQRVQILSQVAGVATCDKSLGTLGSTGGNGKLGGAVASPAIPAGLMIAGNTVFVKSGAYTISSGSSNVANGVLSVSVGNDSLFTGIVGYDSTRTITNTDSTYPVLTASAISSVSIVKNTNTFSCLRIRNIQVNGASLSSIVAFEGTTTGTTWERCKASNSTTGFKTGGIANKCFASACGTGFTGGITQLGCQADACTVVGFLPAAGTTEDCIASNCSGASTDGFQITGQNNGVVKNCTAYNNGRHGFFFTSFCRQVTGVNLLSTNNGGYGVNITSSAAGVTVLNSFTRSNTSGGVNPMYTGQDSGSTALTADPYTNAGSGDFSLNTTAGGGAAVRAAGFPGVLPAGLTTSYLDGGAVQHADPAGGTGGASNAVHVWGSEGVKVY